MPYFSSQTASTKRESPKIEGAKILVGLRADAKCTENPPSVLSRTWIADEAA
jgi:hypothetical protein